MKGKHDEIENITPSFWASLLFTLPFLARSVEPWLQSVLATIILLIGAWPFIEKVKTFNRFTLLGAAIVLAYGFSIFEFFVADKPHYLFKEMAVITTLSLFWLHIESVLFGEVFKGVDAFLSLIPEKASKLFSDGHVEKIKVKEVKIGDCVQVKKNQVFPVDGMLLTGHVEIDESELFGKREPLRKKFGESVFAGSKNLSDSCSVKAQSVGDETLYAKIAAMLLKALKVDSITQQLISHVIYATFVAAAVGFILWLFIGGLADAVSTVCTIFVIVSLSAFELGKRIGAVQAITNALEEGIVLSDASVCSRIHSAEMLVMGKRAIVTQGKLSVVAVESVEGVSQKELLETAAALELQSPHAIGLCVVKKATSLSIEPLSAYNVEAVPGLGLRGTVRDVIASIGDEKLVAEQVKDEFLDIKAKAKEFRKQGFIVLFCAKGESLLGIIVISDPLQEGAKGVVSDLKEKGLKLFCLSGDRRITVAHIAYLLGLDRFQSECTISQKLATLQKLKREGRSIALLVNATVANSQEVIQEVAQESKNQKSVVISMGDKIVEGVDVAITSVDLTKVPVLWNIAALEGSITSKNRAICWLYTPVALFLALTHYITIIPATLAMMIVSIVVVSNCMRSKSSKI